MCVRLQTRLVKQKDPLSYNSIVAALQSCCVTLELREMTISALFSCSSATESLTLATLPVRRTVRPSVDETDYCRKNLAKRQLALRRRVQLELLDSRFHPTYGTLPAWLN